MARGYMPAQMPWRSLVRWGNDAPGPYRALSLLRAQWREKLWEPFHARQEGKIVHVEERPGDQGHEKVHCR